MRKINLMWMDRMRELVKKEKSHKKIVEKFLKYGHDEEMKISKLFDEREEIHNFKMNENELRIKNDLENEIC